MTHPQSNASQQVMVGAANGVMVRAPAHHENPNANRGVMGQRFHSRRRGSTERPYGMDMPGTFSAKPSDPMVPHVRTNRRHSNTFTELLDEAISRQEAGNEADREQALHALQGIQARVVANNPQEMMAQHGAVMYPGVAPPQMTAPQQLQPPPQQQRPQPPPQAHSQPQYAESDTIGCA
eukprot:CAMPEP_0196722408 /NCGR_PEP_ID=MMETSP1091-20130531/4777_1 /TAXON_ID=302021 /ORGANISM="Rhodomonas sp., Strain CCMP768" /LENGTH=178 /DNA_ID=CAMNT_0042064101 /DNA_START=11 /DNA_END=547 /DNA_ORIENTATION=-